MKATEHMRYEQYLEFLRCRQLVDDTTSFESISFGFLVWLKVVEQSEQLLRQAELGTISDDKHPSLIDCFNAGAGKLSWDKTGTYKKGGLPDTEEERKRFESYMRGHCWDIGNYDKSTKCYDTTFVRCAYGVWRDRGALALCA